jgi:hypothetical protein
VGSGQRGPAGRTCGKSSDHEINAPDHQNRRNQVPGEQADPGETEQVVEDHRCGQRDRDRRQLRPPVEAMPQPDEDASLETDPAERRNHHQQRHQPRADPPEHGAGEERQRLPGLRAEVGADQRVGHVDPVSEQAGAGRDTKGEAPVIHDEPGHHEREARDQRRPQSHEVPHRPALIPRHDASPASGEIVVPRHAGRAVPRAGIRAGPGMVRWLPPEARKLH